MSASCGGISAARKRAESALQGSVTEFLQAICECTSHGLATNAAVLTETAHGYDPQDIYQDAIFMSPGENLTTVEYNTIIFGVIYGFLGKENDTLI